MLHWRTAHRLGLKSKKDKHGLNENCVICDEGKRKVSGYKRNFEFMGVNSGPLRPYWRMYCDGYGGQGSMGAKSYEGAKGGFVFACPTGSIKQRLYGSTKQFPTILFQVLRGRKAAEEVAAMYRVRIIPIYKRRHSSGISLCRVCGESGWSNVENVNGWSYSLTEIMLGLS